MVHIEHTFDTYEEAYEWMNAYLAQYHPAGYGTMLTPPIGLADGRWIVRGSRYSSCD